MRLSSTVKKANSFILVLSEHLVFCCYFSRARLPYQVEKKKWVIQRLMCQKREFATRSSFCEVTNVTFKDPKCKHEIFMRIDMKHSYFSNYFIVSEL